MAKKVNSKMKTRSAAKKRFGKVTKNGKIKRAQGYRRHLLTRKSAKRKRQLRVGMDRVHESDQKMVDRLLPYA